MRNTLEIIQILNNRLHPFSLQQDVSFYAQQMTLY